MFMAFLSTKVHSDIHIHVAEVVVGLELRFGVIIGMYDAIGAEIPF